MGPVSVSNFLPEFVHLRSSQYSDLVLLILCACLAAFALLHIRRSALQGRRCLPPSPSVSLPIIGHLYLFPLFSHRGLAKLSEKYGSIFLLRFGSLPTVVISSAALAKQFLNDHDQVFSHRPRMEIAQRLFYGNNASVLMDSNARWREIRKFYAQELLSARNVQLFKPVRDEEISFLLQNIETQSGSVVRLRELLFDMTLNNLSRALFSRRADGRFAVVLTLLKETVQNFSAPIIGDFIPYLKWLDPGGYQKKMDFIFQRWDAIFDNIVKERLKETHGLTREGKPLPSDMLNSLLGFDEKIVKASLLELLIAGTETSTTTMEYAAAELLRSPATMQKLQEELDRVVGAGRQVKESDFANLPYLKAVMQETWRLHPPLPLLLPHLAKEETEVAGYKLPKNTRLMVNAWAIGRDSKVWKEAEEFRPERFLTGGGDEKKDVKGQDYELLPFGTGRRGCPGIHMGMAVSFLGVANLMHSFNWNLTGDSSSLCMDDTLDASAFLAHPLCAIPTPRHPPRSCSDTPAPLV